MAGIWWAEGRNRRGGRALMGRLGGAWGLLILPALLGAGSDLSGSRDPLGIARYPYSWIVAYEQDERFLPREYALGRVDKTRRDLRVEHEVRTSAALEWATYQMPSGVTTQDVATHYLKLIGGETLFTCRGRDCGRSNLWANDVFQQAILYGPDDQQFYYAGELGDHLVALYVIERGNKRVYAHLEVLKPESNVALSPNAEIADRLAGEGLAVVEGLVPPRSGRLSADDREQLAAIAPGLDIFAGQTVYVVCHLYGPESADTLLTRAETCAEVAAESLTAPGGPQLVPFAAGPLLPRLGSGSRIELVLPHNVSHQ